MASDYRHPPFLLLCGRTSTARTAGPEEKDDIVERLTMRLVLLLVRKLEV
jgi:hypothetical protein